MGISQWFPNSDIVSGNSVKGRYGLDGFYDCLLRFNMFTIRLGKVTLVTLCVTKRETWAASPSHRTRGENVIRFGAGLLFLVTTEQRGAFFPPISYWSASGLTS